LSFLRSGESPGAKFCSECGVGLVATTASREERKVVTVLFADLVGFTARAEQLDDVRSVLAPYYARLRSELERFGGTVEKFIGDAVMAVFGAPVAHEDDPERAVRAALAIRDAAAAYDEIGAQPFAALAALRAAETYAAQGRRIEANEQLSRALQFWRSVGAKRYVREGEALLAKSA
jgi:hypothetical protein